MFPFPRNSSPLLTISSISAASIWRGGKTAVASALLCDHSSSRPLRSTVLSLARRSSRIRSMTPTKPRGGRIMTLLRSLADRRHLFGPAGLPSDSTEPVARPMITTSTSAGASVAETIKRAGASTGHRRAALIINCRARSRKSASSDCETNDRRAESGGSEGDSATARAPGCRAGSGGTPGLGATDTKFARSGGLLPWCELQRYETVPATAAVAITITPVA